MKKIKLNALDQSPIFTGQTAVTSINRSIALAKQVEEMGFHRYWVAEHHNQKAFASASPELMAAKIGAETSTIRVGTAGILVGHYAPLKVAETARMLSTLCDGRFDLGIGRSPGAVHGALLALGDHEFGPAIINAKQDEVYAYLNDEKTVYASPEGAPQLECWVLGAGPGSALYAAERGISYAYASFANPKLAKQSIQAYRENFKPSAFLKAPAVNLAVAAYCADTEEKAKRMSLSSVAWSMLAERGGHNIPFPSMAESESLIEISNDPEVESQMNDTLIVGNQSQVSEKLTKLIEELDLDELTLLTVTESAEDLLKHYQLIAEGLEI
ncbi:MsnO8 family LLM class oxidoreductase [Pseudoalteromonas umbrosa]|uniref:MsnO8 family LLM class oxidoreductase n=1 Tax=Pseudoalteromonas umbrosa TaxID=3048489 RepID=UPI0024C37C7E|nr:MsnO8 family LLM class oxidoreductase [Pseudoalteromonas sp. B95]MDK1288432.1 MsnO8 family LLM class oxidoreductase [Pseudoalteromonas sp. B95]